MIGIVLHRDGLRFSMASGDSTEVYDHPLEDESPFEPRFIEKAFDAAKSELHFDHREDFRLLVDTPWAHSIAQSVPFNEKQLSQVLENYLEEELSEDIEAYRFDYHVFHSQGQHSAILGFWIHADLLRAWCHFADEMSLNSFDIQPAELALISKLDKDHPQLLVRKDLESRWRFCSLSIHESLPQLSLGIIPSSATPAQFLTTIKLQGTHWQSVNEILVERDDEDTVLDNLHKELGISKIQVLEPQLRHDPFSPWALSGGTFAFHYRKGELAQKGIEERLVYPTVVVSLVLALYLAILSWQNFALTEHEHAKRVIASKQKVEIWNRLFPERNAPTSRMPQTLEGELKLLTGEGDGPSDDEDVSALQSLGKLFSYIEAEDAIFIERASIGRTIQITGRSDNQPSIYRLGDGFAQVTEFREPNINAVDRGTEFSFRFDTAYIGDKK